MPSINRIRIRRGNSNGGIDENTYDIGAGSGSVAAYGQIKTGFYQEQIDGQIVNVANVELASEFNDFAFEKNDLICIRIEDGIDTSGGENLYLKIFKSDGVTQVEDAHFVARQFTGSDYLLPANSLANDTAILLLCRINQYNTKQYYLIADNFKPRVSSDGIMTIG